MTLYERILGEEFQELSPLVQAMHRYENAHTLKGSVNIKRGKSFMAKLLNPLMRLPKEQTNAFLMLELKAQNEKEIWKRTFGEDNFSSSQYQEAEQMIERMGLIKMYFDVYVEDASLCTRLVKTTFLGLTLPKFLAVAISSKVKEEDEKLLFSVKVETFRGDEVISYDGIIEQ